MKELIGKYPRALSGILPLYKKALADYILGCLSEDIVPSRTVGKQIIDFAYEARKVTQNDEFVSRIKMETMKGLDARYSNLERKMLRETELQKHVDMLDKAYNERA